MSAMNATAGSRLLDVIKGEFTPTLEFEKKLTESFLKKLQQCFEQNLTGSSTKVLQDFIMCVLAVSEIDNKFIQYHFAITTNSTVYLLVSILRRHSFSSGCHEKLLTLRILQLIEKIVLQIPLMRNSFINEGLHQALIFKTHGEFQIDSIKLHFSILDALTDTDCQKTLNEILSVSCVDWILHVIENWLKQGPSHQQSSEQLLMIALDFVSKIANNGPLNNANHTRKFDTVFFNLTKTLPQHKQLFQDIHIQLNSATCFTVGKPGVNKKTAVSSQTVRRQYSKSTIQPLELSFKDLKLDDHFKLCPMSRKPLSENFKNRQFVFLRYSFVEVMDPTTNVLFPERHIKDISLTNTAEMICGMLNSNKGGHIHIGISSSGQIEGVRINFDERDGFRCGIDNLFHHKITPLIPSSMIDVQFIPVKDELKVLDSDHSLFVIRVTLPANTNTVYYLKNDTCYLYGPQGNAKLNLREVRNLAVTFTEQRLFLKCVPNQAG